MTYQEQFTPALIHSFLSDRRGQENWNLGDERLFTKDNIERLVQIKQGRKLMLALPRVSDKDKSYKYANGTSQTRPPAESPPQLLPRQSVPFLLNTKHTKLKLCLERAGATCWETIYPATRYSLHLRRIIQTKKGHLTKLSTWMINP